MVALAAPHVLGSRASLGPRSDVVRLALRTLDDRERERAAATFAAHGVFLGVLQDLQGIPVRVIAVGAFEVQIWHDGVQCHRARLQSPTDDCCD